MARERSQLDVGDRVRVYGSYDFQDTWIDGEPDGYVGTLEAFVPGQGDSPAAVIQLEQEIAVEVPRDDGRLSARGRYLVLELAYVGSDWTERGDRVHVELCGTEPAPQRWQDREQGAWVESHAQYERIPRKR